ncbi:hypothetical protein VN97_g3379 [Penicillium thymicola]|uniref:Uncharacterized protein n=1 Tax=Penicillium thymicola TaxID=293382 RepID=A0AAI9TMK4_PENTH|nr:hypothetical protein VN97_g3379 [Penicillium thymicola]
MGQSRKFVCLQILYPKEGGAYLLWWCHLTLCDRVSHDPMGQDCSLLSLFFFSPSLLAVSSLPIQLLSLSSPGFTSLIRYAVPKQSPDRVHPWGPTLPEYHDQ